MCICEKHSTCGCCRSLTQIPTIQPLTYFNTRQTLHVVGLQWHYRSNLPLESSLPLHPRLNPTSCGISYMLQQQLDVVPPAKQVKVKSPRPKRSNPELTFIAGCSFRLFAEEDAR